MRNPKGDCPAELAQESALEPEVDPQPLGNREHELAMGHLGANVLAHPAGLFQPQQRRMVHFRSESDVHGVRRVGPQTGAEIIDLMKQLGWQPRLSSLDVLCAIGSATDSLTQIAAKARRLAKANPEAAKELLKLAARAADTAKKLTQLRGEMHNSRSAVEGPTPWTHI